VRTIFGAGVFSAVVLISCATAFADGSGDPAAVKNEGGKYFDKNGVPTFKVGGDSTVDWYTYSGSGDIIRNAMCAMARTARARAMRPPS